MKKASLIKIFTVIVLTAVFLFTTGMTMPSDAEAKAKLNPKDFIRIDYIHYVKNASKPSSKPEADYKLMGVKWKTFPVTYSLNYASVPSGLDPAATAAALSQSSEVWDAEYSPNLFTDTVANTSRNYGLLDGTNAVEFKTYSNNGVIAITSVWYNRATKAISEFDMLFNTYFTWGDASSNGAVMDIKNIATHELGHAIGLADLYSQSNSQLTMYGYASEGETLKRDLYQGDINGLHKIYGY